MRTDDSTMQIRAAGGILYRDTPAGRVFAIIHRTQHNDWTLPKGKLNPGEDWLDAAIREVLEETGCHVNLANLTSDNFICEIMYMTKGCEKFVRYWPMEAVGECAFVPGDEVDRLEWLPWSEASARLTYDRDRDVLSNAKPLSQSPTMLSGARESQPKVE